MKRYNLIPELDMNGAMQIHPFINEEEHPAGEWCKWEDVEQLALLLMSAYHLLLASGGNPGGRTIKSEWMDKYNRFLKEV